MQHRLDRDPARAVDPSNTCQVIFTGEWSLAGKEAEAVNATIEGMSRAVFANCGQVCLNTERVYVERPLFERFVEQLKTKLDALPTAAQRAAVSGHKDTSACIFWEASFAPVGPPSRWLPPSPWWPSSPPRGSPNTAPAITKVRLRSARVKPRESLVLPLNS